MSVRRSIPLSVALFSLLALPVVLVPNSHAQINGVPSSVTSPGFGGRPVNGTPPSVSSVGPRGFTPNSHVTFSTGNGMPPGDGHHHHHHFVQYAPSVVYPVPVPYAVDIGDAEDNSEDDDANYQGGPTIFDRRGSGADSYVPPVKNIRRPPTTETADADDPPAPSAPQVPTLLVFKDGHKLEVGNYAIVGDTLFDLTPGHVRKVALADLDLDATRKTKRRSWRHLPAPAIVAGELTMRRIILGTVILVTSIAALAPYLSAQRMISGAPHFAPSRGPPASLPEASITADRSRAFFYPLAYGDPLYADYSPAPDIPWPLSLPSSSCNRPRHPHLPSRFFQNRLYRS